MKIDLGCGPKKRDGYFGIDKTPFPGVDLVFDIGSGPLPIVSGIVEAVYSSHFMEHLTKAARIYVWNDIYRVMKAGAVAEIIVPHWKSPTSYGDLTHEWPPFSEYAFLYLVKSWRDENAPHVALTCDFDLNLFTTMHPNTGENYEIRALLTRK